MVTSEASGEWSEYPCFDMAHCLCECGIATSDDYVNAINEETQLMEVRRLTMLVFAIIIPSLMALPLLVALPRLLLCLCTRNRAHAEQPPLQVESDRGERTRSPPHEACQCQYNAATAQIVGAA